MGKEKRKVHSFDKLDLILEQEGYCHITELVRDYRIGEGVEVELICYDTPEEDVTTKRATVLETSFHDLNRKMPYGQTSLLIRRHALVRMEDGTEVNLFGLFEPRPWSFGYKIIGDNIDEIKRKERLARRDRL